jgi:hypothetical protein
VPYAPHITDLAGTAVQEGSSPSKTVAVGTKVKLTATLNDAVDATSYILVWKVLDTGQTVDCPAGTGCVLTYPENGATSAQITHMFRAYVQRINPDGTRTDFVATPETASVTWVPFTITVQSTPGPVSTSANFLEIKTDTNTAVNLQISVAPADAVGYSTYVDGGGAGNSAEYKCPQFASCPVQFPPPSPPSKAVGNYTIIVRDDTSNTTWQSYQVKITWTPPNPCPGAAPYCLMLSQGEGDDFTSFSAAWFDSQAPGGQATFSFDGSPYSPASMDSSGSVNFSFNLNGGQKYGPHTIGVNDGTESASATYYIDICAAGTPACLYVGNCSTGVISCIYNGSTSFVAGDTAYGYFQDKKCAGGSEDSYDYGPSGPRHLGAEGLDGQGIATGYWVTGDPGSHSEQTTDSCSAQPQASYYVNGTPLGALARTLLGFDPGHAGASIAVTRRPVTAATRPPATVGLQMHLLRNYGPGTAALLLSPVGGKERRRVPSATRKLGVSNESIQYRWTNF